MLQVICKTFAFSCCPDNVHVCAMSVCVRVLCVCACAVCALCNVCNSINFVHEMKTKTPHRDEDAATSRMFSSAIVCLACRLSGHPFSCTALGLSLCRPVHLSDCVTQHLAWGQPVERKNMYAISVNLSFTYDCLSLLLSSLSLLLSVCVCVCVICMCTTWQYHLSIN